MTQDERIRHLEANGLRTIYMAPADPRVLDLTPADFIEEILKKRLQSRLIICGEDFRFGNKAAGDVATLRAHAGGDYELCVIPDLYAGGDVISSTRIREALLAGEMETAAEMLGHPFYYKSTVVRAKSSSAPRFRRSTCRSMMVSLSRARAFASRVQIGGDTYCGISNVGYKPTVGDNDTLGRDLSLTTTATSTG